MEKWFNGKCYTSIDGYINAVNDAINEQWQEYDKEKDFVQRHWILERINNLERLLIPYAGY